MSFGPEDQLLICCSRVEMGEEALTRASWLLQQNLDWDYILEASIAHGVSPLFFCTLNKVMQGTAKDLRIPTRVFKHLEKLYRGNLSRNRRLYRVIGDIFRNFERAGVEAIALKDVHLARQIYPDLGMRPLGDIDLLIRRKDYQRVAAVLGDLGFLSLPSADIPFTLKYASAQDFRRPSDNVWIDVQWNILDREWDVCGEGEFTFKSEDMWRGATQTTIDDYQLRVPRPEDMLFHLCLHLEGHSYSELILFADIAELLRHSDAGFSWDYFIELTRRYKAESSVYYVFRLVQHLFQVPLPHFVLRELEPDYFKVGIFSAVFGNLSSLHLFLDEARQAVAPPERVMLQFERNTRQQACVAIHLYKAIDQVASAFAKVGGALVILDGTASEKIFPDSRLRPFEELRFLILDRDLPPLRQALSHCGFELDAAGGCQFYLKTWTVRSADPVLAGQTLWLKLRGAVEDRLETLCPSSEEGSNSTKKSRIATKLVRAKLSGRKCDETCFLIPFQIVALSPEEMLVGLSARLGRQERGSLLALCRLLEFFRGYSGSLDWQRISHWAQRYRVGPWVYVGLQMVSDFLDADRIPAGVLNALARSELRSRVLQTARHDPASEGRFSDFRRAFFYVYTLLSIEGTAARATYAFRSLFRFGGKSYLPDPLLQLIKCVYSLLRKGKPKSSDVAYWIEPAST